MLLQTARDAALEREAQLTAEKTQLKAALGTALEQKALVDSQLAAAASEHQQVQALVSIAPDMSDKHLTSISATQISEIELLPEIVIEDSSLLKMPSGDIYSDVDVIIMTPSPSSSSSS